MDSTPSSPTPPLDAQTLRGLAQLAARADEITALVDLASGLLPREPVVADPQHVPVPALPAAESTGDGAGDGAAAALADQLPRLRALAKPANVERATDAAEAVAAALEHPDVQSFLHSDLAASMATLGRLARRLDEVEHLLNLVTGVLRRGPEIADSLNATLNHMRKDLAKPGAPIGLELLKAYAPALDELKTLAEPDRVVGLLQAGTVFQEAFTSEGVQALIHSTILDPAAVDTISGLAQSLIVAAQEAPAQQPTIKGPISLLRALNDPHVARTLSFAMGVARAFGMQLEGQDQDQHAA
ncbi:MAG: DUF1641 domain-containing protein [Bacteroidota bacterium]